MQARRPWDNTGRRIAGGRSRSAKRQTTLTPPPSLYWCVDAGKVIIVSEPLDTEANSWNRVPAGHVLIAEAGAQISCQRLEIA